MWGAKIAGKYFQNLNFTRPVKKSYLIVNASAMIFRERKQQEESVRMLQEIPAGRCSRQAQIPHLRLYIDSQNRPVQCYVADLVGGITVQLAELSVAIESRRLDKALMMRGGRVLDPVTMQTSRGNGFQHLDPRGNNGLGWGTWGVNSGL